MRSDLKRELSTMKSLTLDPGSILGNVNFYKEEKNFLIQYKIKFNTYIIKYWFVRLGGSS